MEFSQSELNRRLRGVFERAGYRRYRMSKFEEYDLYAQNKDFLVSENVLTFTDLDGRLMALKPDVTLSIVKNCPTEGIEKLYYHENVYRAAGLSFREIAQAGLECIGEIDEYSVCEVLALAAESLETISENCELAVSHLGIFRDALRNAGLQDASQSEVFRLTGEKNFGELEKYLEKQEIPEKFSEKILRLAAIDLPAAEASKELKEVLDGLAEKESIDLFSETCDFLGGEFPRTVRVDFSTVGDLRYYSGIFFKGYVDGVPTGVLSGGQYDGLMKKLRKPARAIGFALYLDALEPLFNDGADGGADILLLYPEKASARTVFEYKKMLSRNGETVCAMRLKPHGKRFKKVYMITEGGVLQVE